MKALLVLVLGSLCGAALAGEAKDAEQIPVEQYSYSQHLDIARVISMSEVPNVCEVVPARMTYEDSQGQKHILEYRVMGNGCSNG
ncbi:DUF2790 domain-containing protein [Pseudomonas sichuanensis]|jgi:septum formation inhibitor MinC|uniref:DUF2790 domain-containing protein n=1 Tax=Pseudomonas oryziphila TaxID=2894079 RepID=A0ABN5TJJ6_9PSED|nr:MULTISPECIES: DUF2790 domain-containing protein [Pseudomonas]AZL75060.1 DUF2790 domain-containing protein [Pseudomonas oryziphila]MDH0729416.1 DUF2790 domain-containing protein [Pseudomonas sichuanensis]MDH1583183.1 DUF2790 domain-containing protein [Pseudomonas sichuanensis]MDH1590753.1 DUF2790 domain-containing protein [Pseudomonas sichuanensis]MDH1596050.1 DUF2790 domain-containing protein [Pseudomonas sichuanensis]